MPGINKQIINTGGGGGGGGGDVVGPASSTDNAIARFNGTTGKSIQSSGASIDDSGNITATNLSGTNTGDAPIAVKDEGSTLTSALTSIDFVGAGVTATNTGDAVTVTIPGTLSECFGITVDGSGSAITTGTKGYRVIPYDCTITGWELIGKESGSIVFDVKKSTYAGFPTTSSIAGTEKPTLSSAQKNNDLSLSTWTTSISSGDIIEFIVDSSLIITRVTLTIFITKT